MIMTVCNFKFRFEGQAIQDGLIDRDQLIPSLIALKDALFLFHKEINHNTTMLSMQAEISNNGNFHIALKKKENFLSSIASFFIRGRTNFGYEYALVKELFELMKLLLWLNGRNPEKINIADDRSTVTYSLEDNSYTTDFITYQGFRSYKLFNLFCRFLAPLHENGIEKIRLTLGNENIIIKK